MKEKLWGNPITLEKIEMTMNDCITNQKIDFQKGGLLEKWNYFAILKTAPKEVIDKILETIQLIDEFIDGNEQKIEHVLTLVYLFGREKIEVEKMNANSIYLLVVYLNQFSLANMKPSLVYFNNEVLLTKIRMKTLDLDLRLKLMKYLDRLKKPVDQVIQAIDATEYYELLKILES